MPRALCFLAAVLPVMAAGLYQSGIAKWREEREARLKADDGWLTVAGLFWLKEGANRFGSDPANDMVLPASAPAHAGVFDLRGRTVTARVGDGAPRALWPDTSGPPDRITLGPLTLFVIERGGRYAIRLRDRNSPLRREFTGLRFFPAREDYRVTAKFVPHPRTIPIANVLGQTEPMESPGYVEFRLRGRDLRLYPVFEEPNAKSLFFIFRDQTSGKETYGAGRFLDTDLPKDGKVVVDFNKAYNPPCAFTPYATCPLPPKENRLPVGIEAGELKYGSH